MGIAIIGVIVLISIGIGIYFALTHKKSSTDSPQTGTTPADVVGGDDVDDDDVDSDEWLEATSLDGDIQKSIICDGRNNDGNIICNNQEECLDIATTDWRDLINFVTYENTGYGEDGKYGQCTGSNYSTGTKYKMISIGTCQTMGENNNDTEGTTRVWNTYFRTI